ncbi:MAG: hypothetical protein HW373_728 [Deltaproteobacteria bacterium]|nr:hypothetical protein [Deltaproteobacteria bacterium]
MRHFGEFLRVRRPAVLSKLRPPLPMLRTNSRDSWDSQGALRLTGSCQPYAPTLSASSLVFRATRRFARPTGCDRVLFETLLKIVSSSFPCRGSNQTLPLCIFVFRPPVFFSELNPTLVAAWLDSSCETHGGAIEVPSATHCLDEKTQRSRRRLLRSRSL